MPLDKELAAIEARRESDQSNVDCFGASILEVASIVSKLPTLPSLRDLKVAVPFLKERMTSKYLLLTADEVAVALGLEIDTIEIFATNEAFYIPDELKSKVLRKNLTYYQPHSIVCLAGSGLPGHVLSTVNGSASVEQFIRAHGLHPTIEIKFKAKV